MYLLGINRPDNSVYYTIMWDRGANGYKFVNLLKIFMIYRKKAKLFPMIL